MLHAQLDENGVCTGYSNLTKVESAENLVYLPEGWNEYFLYRKWENGAWSEAKFLPPVPTPQPTIQELQAQINELTAMLGDVILGGV